MPAGRPRDPAWFFVSTRPAEKVKEEVSVIFGYPLKSNTDATVEVGNVNFAMYTQNDGAWVKNAAEESRLVDALRRALVGRDGARRIRPRHQDHRQILAEGHRPGAGPRRAGVQVVFCHSGAQREGGDPGRHKHGRANGFRVRPSVVPE